jgi:hypothetical protein
MLCRSWLAHGRFTVADASLGMAGQGAGYQVRIAPLGRAAGKPMPKAVQCDALYLGALRDVVPHLRQADQMVRFRRSREQKVCWRRIFRPNAGERVPGDSPTLAGELGQA